MPSTPQYVDLPSAALDGSWLFKRDGVLLGPVPSDKLMELLYSGEVDEETLVAPFELSPRYEPLGRIEGFRVHVAKSKAKLRVEAHCAEKSREGKRRRTWRAVGIGILGLSLLLGGGRLALWLAISRPWERQITLPEPIITDEVPHIVAAAARPGDQELAYREETKVVASSRPGSKRGHNLAVAARSGDNLASSQANQARQGPRDSLTEQNWDQNAINLVVRNNKSSVYSCLALEAKRQRQGWEARVPIEFTIGNDGRVSKLWIDNPDLKDEAGELHRCMFAELQKWKFPVYRGELANVSLAFRIQAR